MSGYDETFSEHPRPSQVDIEKEEDGRFVDRSQMYSFFGQKKKASIKHAYQHRLLGWRAEAGMLVLHCSLSGLVL